MKPSRPADNSWDLHQRTTSTWRSELGVIIDSKYSLLVHHTSIVLSDLWNINYVYALFYWKKV